MRALSRLPLWNAEGATIKPKKIVGQRNDAKRIQA